MTTSNTTAGDEGGDEAPCFAHLLADHAQPTNHNLADLVRQLADAVVIADSDGVITFWNDAATRTFGWPAAEAVGRSLDLIIPERLRERHWAGYRQTMATGRTSYGDRLLARRAGWLLRWVRSRPVAGRPAPSPARRWPRLAQMFTLSSARRGSTGPHTETWGDVDARIRSCG
jgi:PAS domain S-box-containing protein